nr:hypothetical protein [Tanacetum cinerariifolium]
EERPKAKMTKAARLFSMLEAPVLATVKLGFLNRLALIVRRSDLMLILFLQGIVIGILFLNVDGLPRDSATYLNLRACLVGAIVIAPLSLALVYFTPSEYVGPVTISAILVVVILAASYVKVRRVQTGRQTRRQRRV